MKPVRLLLIILGVLSLLGAVAVALALTPAVQRWAVLRAAAARPGLHLRADSVAAGPTSLVLRGVQIEQAGVVVTFDRLDADFSFFELLFNSRLELDRLEALGLTVDATKASRNKVIAAAVAAPAGLVQVKLPFELLVGEIKVEGRALLPGAFGRPAVHADFAFSGGHFAPGAEGTLRLKARLVDPMPGARVAAVELQAGLQIKQSVARSFDRVGVTALLDAEGPRISGQNQLKIAADLARTLSGGSYLLHVSTLNDGQAQDMLVASARSPLDSKNFSGDWILTARSGQIEPFLIGGGLPKFDARGSGTFTLNSPARELALRGSIDGSASELEAMLPALRAVGAVSLKSEFDLAVDAGGVQMNKLDLHLAGDRPVLELHASEAAAFNLKSRRLEFVAPAAATTTTRAGEILHVKLTGLPVAWIRPFFRSVDVSGGGISGEIALFSEEGHRMVAQTKVPLRIDGITVVRSGRALVKKADLNLEAEAELVPAGAQVRFRSVTLKTAGGDLIHGEVTVTSPLALKGPVILAGDFAADLPDMLTPWFPGARLHAHGAADCTCSPARMEVRRLRFEAEDDNGQKLAAASVSREFGLDLGTLRADTGDAEVELARLNLGRVPLGLLLRSRWGLTATGETSPEEFVFAAQGEKLKFRALSPWSLEDVTVEHGHRPLLDRVKIEFLPELELTGGGLSRATSGDFAIHDSSGGLVGKFNLELTGAPTTGKRGTLSFTVDLPTFMAQPFFSRAETISAGQASGEIRAAMLDGGAAQLEARATLNGLVAREGPQALPVANLSFRGVVEPDGRFSVQAPVLLDSAGQRSDLKVSVDGARREGSVVFDAHVTAGHIDLGDVLSLSAAAGEPLGADVDSDATQSRALSPPAADERPFWSAFTGQVSIDCKEVVRGKAWTMNDFTGRLGIEAERVELQKISADFGDNSKLSANGELVFSAGLNPYHLTGEFGLTEFDTGRFFKALNPTLPPTVEGICNLQGKLDGQGLTLDDTLDRTRGQFELASRKGVFRGLKRASEKVSMASKAVEWSAALGSLLKTGRVKEAAEKVAGSGYYVDQLARELAELNYDQFSLKLVRDEALNLRLNEVTLVSQEVRLVGNGLVTYESGKGLLEQPLSLTLNFGSRGKIEQILGKLHVLDGTRDELDYARARDAIVLYGTLSRPDPIPYYLGLMAAKAGEEHQ